MITVRAKISNALTGAPVKAQAQITDGQGRPIRVNGHYISRRTESDGSLILPIATPERAFVTISAPGYKNLTLPAEVAAGKTELKIYGQDVSENILDDVVVISSAVERIFPESAQDPDKRRALTLALGVVAALAVAALVYFIIKKSKA